MTDVSFKLRVCGHEIAATVKLPDEPVRPADLFPIFAGLSSAYVGAASSGCEITCKAGCGACCRQPVPISETEAIYLAGIIAEMPVERRQEIIDRFQLAAAKIRDANLLERFKADALETEEDRRIIADDYMKLNIPCPFLEDESCSIHPHRPLTCREYLVTSPAEACQHPTADTVHAIPMPRRLSYILYRFNDGVGAGPVRFLPLTLMFEQPEFLQTKLPAPEMFQNFFQAATAPVD